MVSLHVVKVQVLYNKVQQQVVAPHALDRLNQNVTHAEIALQFLVEQEFSIAFVLFDVLLVASKRV